MTPVKKRTTAAQWLVLTFMVGVVGVAVWFASKDPDTDWGPVILAMMVPIGMIVRALFKPPADGEDDGYGGR